MRSGGAAAQGAASSEDAEPAPGPRRDQILAFSLAHSGLGPNRIAAELASGRWGGLVVAERGVAVPSSPRSGRPAVSPRARGRQRRAAGARAGTAARAPPRGPASRRAPRHGLLLRGRLFRHQVRRVAIHGDRRALGVLLGRAPQKKPRESHCSSLARRVACDLAAAGWSLEAVTTDNGWEFRNGQFTATVGSLGARHRLIRAGRPTSNGAVERVQRTVLEECWRPSFARSLVPRYTALRRDLDPTSTTTTSIGPTPGAPQRKDTRRGPGSER